MTDVSREYAEALFALARESGEEDLYGHSLHDTATIFHENPEYAALLSSPNIPKEERLNTLTAAFQPLVPKHVLSFLLLLCERGYIKMLDKCIEQYNILLLASKEVSTAQVISAAPLTEEEKVRLVRKLEGISKHTVVAEYSLDQTLLGGVIVHMDGTVLDGSLKKRLRDVKEVMDK